MMMMNSTDEASLAGWEGEGGSLGAASRRTAVLGRVSCLPALPFEHVAQPVWGFLDSTGRYSYEFNQVYGSPRLLHGHGGSAELDENASYWGVTWAERGADGDDHPVGRWVTYAKARELLGRRLSFARFCSPGYMRNELPRLLLGSKEAELQRDERDEHGFARAWAHAG